MASDTSAYVFKGLPLVEKVVNRSRVEAVETYADVRDDDVFMCAYPKAGMHWASDIVQKVIYAGDLQLTKERSTNTYLELTPPDDYVPPYGFMARNLDELSALPSPRVIRSHLHLSMLPSLVLQGKARVIYVYRDPRDIATSYYPFIVDQLTRHGFQMNLTWDEFFEEFFSGRVLFGSWYSHFKDFQDNKERANVLALKYEAMKQDLPGAVATVATFLGKSLTDDAVQRIATSCTFESVKAEFPDDVVFRKGICGDWKNTFTVAQSERMAEEIRRVKETLGLVIDYE